jgi:hypothetical protein
MTALEELEKSRKNIQDFNIALKKNIEQSNNHKKNKSINFNTNNWIM